MGLSTKTTRATWRPLKRGGGWAILPATAADRRYNLRLDFAVDLLHISLRLVIDTTFYCTAGQLGALARPV
jgi:hypothetical protein